VVQVQVLHTGSGCSDVVIAMISPRQIMNLMGYQRDIIGISWGYHREFNGSIMRICPPTSNMVGKIWENPLYRFFNGKV
jgi:hypothetical protein